MLEKIRRYRALEMPWWVRPDRHAAWRDHAAQMLSVFRQKEIEAFECTDVADYFFTGTDKEFWSLDHDFGPFTPFCEVFWMEHRHPAVIASTEGNVIPPVRGRTGWLMFGTLRENVKGEGIPPDAKWVLSGELFIDYGTSPGRFPHPEKIVCGPHGTWSMALTECGALCEAPPCLRSWAAEEHAAMMRAMLGWWHPSLLALGYFNAGKAGIVPTANPCEWEIRRV